MLSSYHLQDLCAFIHWQKLRQYKLQLFLPFAVKDLCQAYIGWTTWICGNFSIIHRHYLGNLFKGSNCSGQKIKSFRFPELLSNPQIDMPWSLGGQGTGWVEQPATGTQWGWAITAALIYTPMGLLSLIFFTIFLFIFLFFGFVWEWRGKK